MNEEQRILFSLKLSDGLAPDGHAYSRLSVVSILAQHWIPFKKKKGGYKCGNLPLIKLPSYQELSVR